MKNRIRLEDIAKRAGVSKMAVSLALRDDPSIGKETIKTIKAIASEMNYIPNKIAKSLVSGRSNTVAAIVGGNVHDDYHNRFLKGAIHQAISRGYTLTIGLDEGDSRIESDLIEKFHQTMVDGFLVFHCGDSANIRTMHDNGFPYVLYTKYFEDLDSNYVVCDDVKGGYLLTRYFITLGHRRIAFIYDPGLEKSSEVLNRIKGYRTALEENDIPFNPDLVLPYEYSFHASGFREKNPMLFQSLLSRDRPTAIFVCNDIVASAFYIAIKSMGYKIPEDFSIGGYEGVYLGEILDPPLTTISAPIEEMGQAASNLLIDIIEGRTDQQPSTKISLEPALTIRNSVIRR